jgi:putative peptidoglycan lipid II flippase
MTLVAYAFGLIPFVLMRSATITFLSRGDTVTPVKALAVAVTVNVAFKILFVYATSLEQVGLALATSIGAWVNLILLLWLASRAGLITVDAALRRTGLRLVAATLMLGLVLWLAASPVADVFAGQKLHEEATLAALAVLGALVYGGVALTLLGKGWLAALRRRQGSIS